MGGDVTLEMSELNKGSIFKITISILPKENAVKSIEKKQIKKNFNQDLTDKRILVVDDSPDNRVLVRLFLKKNRGHSF